MSFEEPTERISAPRTRHTDDVADAPTTALPGPLNLAGPSDPAAAPAAPAASNGTTDVLSLDELFGGEAPVAEAPAAAERTTPTPERATVEEAPTWTAMPVVPVRSEPVTPIRSAGPADAPASQPLGGRVRSDAAAAWDAAVRRTRAWLARDDNGLTLATALVAVILIIAVAGLS